VWRQPLAVTHPFNHNLVASVGQAAQGAVTQDRVIKQSQPLVYRPVAGDNKTGLAVPGNDELIEVG